ncbi:MAG: TonB-dependent receptor [Opitutaceae bacterium]|nr:TonB-dependent receptor [Opitutaceae bacterium]
MPTHSVNVLNPKRCLGALCATLLLALPAVAQTTSTAAPEPSKEETLELTPFRVSSQGDEGYFSKNTLMGTRSNERLVNIPQSIQIVNSEFLNDLGLDNGIDAFKYAVSGINKREALSNDTFIRGFRVGGNSFLRNGIRSRGLYNTPMYDVDRIEVLKGPSALLFGLDGGAGGVVNYLSKQPTAKTESYVKGTLGSFNLYRGEAATSGPLGDSGLSYRATVALTNSDHKRNLDSIEDQFFSLFSKYKISDTASLEVYYNYYYLNQTISKETVDAQGQLMAISPEFSGGEPWQDSPRWTQNAYAALTVALSPTLQSRFLVNGSEQNFDYLNVLIARVPAATGLVNRTFQDRTGKERVIAVQADILKTFDTGPVSHKFTFGGVGKLQRLKTRFDNVVLAPINVFNPVYNTPIPTYTRGIATTGGSVNDQIQRTYDGAIFAQEQATTLEGRLILVGGYGWNGVNNWVFNRLTNATTTQQVDRAFVKRYGAVFKPAPWASLYYSHSESVSFFNQVFVGGPRSGQILDPSFTENKEIGAKAETSNGVLFGSIVFFDMDRTNVTLNYIQPDGTPGVGQEGRETNQGWEADIGIGLKNPMGRTQFILTYYDGDSKNTAGAVPNGVSNKMWSLFATQLFSTGGLTGLKIGGGLYHKDDFPMANASGQTVAFRAPAFTTSTAFVSYTWNKRLDLAVNCDNLSDKRYVDGGDGAGSLDMAVGRTFKFSATFHF